MRSSTRLGRRADTITPQGTGLDAPECLFETLLASCAKTKPGLRQSFVTRKVEPVTESPAATQTPTAETMELRAKDGPLHRGRFSATAPPYSATGLGHGRRHAS